MIVTTIHPPKRKINVEFQLTKNQKLLLIPLGDIHEGTPGWPKQQFLDYLTWGMERGAMFLGMGEYFDFVSASQREIVRLFRDSTKKQIDEMIEERVKKFADLIAFTKGRWMGLLEGHHYWVFEDGLTSDQLFCKELGCNFLGTSALIRICFGVENHPEADCTIYAHHGVGSGRSVGGHLLRLEDLLKWIEADIYLMAHTHTKVSNPIDRQYFTSDGIHFYRTKLLARTGGWLQGYMSYLPKSLDKPAIDSRGSYIERRAMTPTSLGGIAIGIGYDKIEGSRFYRPTINYRI